MEQEPTFKRLREYQESVPPFTRRLYLYAKYGIRDYRGGGRSSARETISRVVAGALAKLALKQLGISVTAYTSQVGPVKLDKDYKSYNLELDRNKRCALSRSGESQGNGRTYLENQRRRRYNRRGSELRHQRMPYRTRATRIR